MNPITVHQMAERVSQLLAERLGAKGRGLRARIESRSRALPRRVRAAARFLAEAETMAQSPKIARQVSMEQVAEAYDICVRYLQPLGAGARRWSLVLSMAASVAFALLVTGGGLIAYVAWRGPM